MQIQITCGENARGENGGACDPHTYGDIYSGQAVSDAECKEKIGPAPGCLVHPAEACPNNGHDRKLAHGSDNSATASGRQGIFQIGLRHRGTIAKRGGNESITPDLEFCTESSVGHPAVCMCTHPHNPLISDCSPIFPNDHGQSALRCHLRVLQS